MMCKVIGFLIRGGLEITWVFVSLSAPAGGMGLVVGKDGMLSSGYMHGRKVNFDSNM